MNDIQKKLLEMIEDIDVASRKENVEYSLVFGSALGAVRHGGFIPWDDDMDIAVSRRDIAIFLKALEKNLEPDKYTIVSPYETDWIRNWYKIKMNNTTAIEEKYRNTRVHQGLFVDVFVVEDYPESPMRRLLHKILYKCYTSVRVFADGQLGNPKYDPIMSLVVYGYKVLEKLMNMLPEKDTKYCAVVTQIGIEILNKNSTESFIDIEFEGSCKLRLFKDYENVLTRFFGDYMKLPPLEERVNKHLIAFSADTDYKDWLKENE